MVDLAVASKFTPEVRKAVIDHIRAGNHITTAVRAAGIEYGTFQKWMAIGEFRSLEKHPTPEFVQFAEEVRRAEAECEAEIVDKIRTAALTDPELGLKFLARRHPERWSERQPPKQTVHWVVAATDMLRKGEITFDLLETELGPELAGEVRKALEAPQGVVIEGHSRSVESTTERSDPGATGEGEGQGSGKEDGLA